MHPHHLSWFQQFLSRFDPLRRAQYAMHTDDQVKVEVKDVHRLLVPLELWWLEELMAQAGNSVEGVTKKLTRTGSAWKRCEPHQRSATCFTIPQLLYMHLEQLLPVLSGSSLTSCQTFRASGGDAYSGRLQNGVCASCRHGNPYKRSDYRHYGYFVLFTTGSMRKRKTWTTFPQMGKPW